MKPTELIPQLLEIAPEIKDTDPKGLYQAADLLRARGYVVELGSRLLVYREDEVLKIDPQTGYKQSLQEGAIYTELLNQGSPVLDYLAPLKEWGTSEGVSFVLEPSYTLLGRRPDLELEDYLKLHRELLANGALYANIEQAGNWGYEEGGRPRLFDFA